MDFEVLDDVKVENVTVIAKGANAAGTVTDAQPKRRMGRAGKLDIALDSVRLVDQEKAALTATTGGKGGSHTGAMVGAMAATAIFTLGGSALFLLMHGKDITIPKGTELTAYVNGDMTLNMTKFTGVPDTGTALAAVVSASQISVDANVANCDSGGWRLCGRYTERAFGCCRKARNHCDQKRICELDPYANRFRTQYSLGCGASTAG